MTYLLLLVFHMFSRYVLAVKESGHVNDDYASKCSLTLAVVSIDASVSYATPLSNQTLHKIQRDFSIHGDDVFSA